MNVLFLSPWYPNKHDAMDGLFVRKHAQAVGRFVDNIEVICLKPRSEIGNIEVSNEILDGVHEIIVYYPNPKNIVKKFCFFYKAFKTGYKLLTAKPDIVQVNVLTRCGVLGYLLWRLKGIPYVIVEHWSRYHREGACFNNWLHKRMTQIVVKNAKYVMPVTHHLAKAMQAQGLSSTAYAKVNNVVDDFFYTDYTTAHKNKKRIIHISCFDEKAKNIKGILRAIKEVSLHRNNFELILVGTGVDFDEVFHEYEILKFSQGVVRFVGEQTPREVCEWLRTSDFMVMFSNYETAGIIFSEAMACGKPIVSTRVGIFADGEGDDSGAFVDIGDERGLERAIDWMLDHYMEYDTEQLRELGREYSFDEVGRKLTDIYNKVLLDE